MTLSSNIDSTSYLNSLQLTRLSWEITMIVSMWRDCRNSMILIWMSRFRRRMFKWMFNLDISDFIIRNWILVSERYFEFIFFKEVLKFIKILTFNVKEDDLTCIVESRSLSLEYLSFKKLKTVYEQFYESFPTTLE